MHSIFGNQREWFWTASPCPKSHPVTPCPLQTKGRKIYVIWGLRFFGCDSGQGAQMFEFGVWFGAVCDSGTLQWNFGLSHCMGWAGHLWPKGCRALGTVDVTILRLLSNSRIVCFIVVFFFLKQQNAHFYSWSAVSKLFSLKKYVKICGHKNCKKLLIYENLRLLYKFIEVKAKFHKSCEDYGLWQYISGQFQADFCNLVVRKPL